MPTNQRRAAARRRAWGRGPILLRFEPLESRELLSTTTATTTGTTTTDTTTTTSAVVTTLPDLHPVSFSTVSNVAPGDAIQVTGKITNTGGAATTTPFQVAIYASNTAGPSATEVILGQATIPAGLQPGATTAYSQTVAYPSVATNGLGASGTVYIGERIDPANALSEATNAWTLVGGAGIDLAPVSIVSHQPASLVGTSLTVSPGSINWGDTLQLTAQVMNTGAGNAPPTRALVVFTPLGSTPGGAADFTVGTVAVPAIGAGQTGAVNLPVALPAAPPAALAGATQFTVSLVQDADYATNNIFPRGVSQGAGKDTAQLTIATATNMTVATAAKADLSAVSIKTPNTTLTFGQSFQATAVIKNVGQGASGPYRVRFLLVGPDGSLNNTIYLGDAQLNGLAAGYSQNVVQNLQLPSTLPNGMTLNSSSAGRIAVLVDPEHAVDLASRSDTAAVTPQIKLAVPTVTTTSSSVTTPLTPAEAKAAARTAGRVAAQKKAASLKARHTLEHNLKVFPGRLVNFVKNGFKNKA